MCVDGYTSIMLEGKEHKGYDCYFTVSVLGETVPNAAYTLPVFCKV